jgi:hypothetical protein
MYCGNIQGHVQLLELTDAHRMFFALVIIYSVLLLLFIICAAVSIGPNVLLLLLHDYYYYYYLMLDDLESGGALWRIDLINVVKFHFLLLSAYGTVIH